MNLRTLEDAVSRAPLFVDHALSSRLEAVEVAQLRAGVDVLSSRRKALGAEALPLAGGVAAYCGPGIALSRAVGLGMSGPVTLGDIETLEGFYRSHRAPAFLLASPFADPSLYTLLGERGFRLDELDSVLVRPIDAGEPPSLPEGEITVQVAAADDARVWVQSSIESFSGSSSPAPPERAEVYEDLYHDPGATYLFARCNGVIAGTGAMYVHDRTTYFFATSTREASRRRGVQTALIQARLALAQAAGCTLAFSRTTSGGPSQRNLERLGFRVVYSRAVMSKHFT